MKHSMITSLVALLSLSVVVPQAHADHGSCQDLHEAVFLDEPKDVRHHIEHGVDLECKDVLGHTALITAINGASLDSFTILMKQRVSTKVKSEFGYSPLDQVRRKYAQIANREGFGTIRGIYQSMMDQLEAATN